MTQSPASIRSEIIQLLPRLRRFALALTGQRAEADDLVQDTVERALRHLHQWEAGTRLDHWMFRIAKNRFIDTRRQHRRSGEFLVDAPGEAVEVAIDGEAAMQSRLTLQQVARAMARLPLEQREALALVVIEGLSYRDAADVLAVPIGTLTSRIARAREALTNGGLT